MDFDGESLKQLKTGGQNKHYFLELIFLELFKGKCCGADEGG